MEKENSVLPQPVRAAFGVLRSADSLHCCPHKPWWAAQWSVKTYTANWFVTQMSSVQSCKLTATTAIYFSAQTYTLAGCKDGMALGCLMTWNPASANSGTRSWELGKAGAQWGWELQQSAMRLPESNLHYLTTYWRNISAGRILHIFQNACEHLHLWYGRTLNELPGITSPAWALLMWSVYFSIPSTSLISCKIVSMDSSEQDPP